ncbi:MAG: orotidine-5'-phosphate decarboxylase [Acidobacteriota bacterium]
MNNRARIIVALDVPSRQEALSLVQRLRGEVGLFKVGSQLFTKEGPDLVREIVSSGEKVFLDLKFHDIPNTVVRAVQSAQSLGVSMLTLHAAGGARMLSEVVQALAGSGAQERPLLLGVTVLTSLSSADLAEVGIASPTAEQVVRLARLAQRCGLDGVVASPEETRLLRQELGATFKIVTPGIRPAGSDAHDQSRVATPSVAVQAGADYLVIGRPVVAAHDPLQALRAVVESI